jgi:hypothetical protein
MNELGIQYALTVTRHGTPYAYMFSIHGYVRYLLYQFPMKVANLDILQDTCTFS